MASCPKHNVKSLTLKGGNFGIGCLGKISTLIDEVTFEGMNLKTLKALEQFLYLEKGNSLTLKNVTCREDYYEGEPGAIKDIRDNGATVQIAGCLWYKTGVRPTVDPKMTAAAGRAPETTGMGTTGGVPTPGGNPFLKNGNLKPITTTKVTGSGSATTDPSASPFGSMKKFKKFSSGSGGEPGTTTGGNPFLAGKKLTKPTTTKENGTAEPEENDPFAAIRGKMKKGTKTAGASKKRGAFDPRSLLKKNIMHAGMLDEKEKEDFKKDLDARGVKNVDFENELLSALEKEWAKLSRGQDIPVDVPFCKNYLKKVVEKAIEYANDRDSSIILSGDFKDETGVIFDESSEMVDLAEALKGARKIKTDIKSIYGVNISFQSKLLEAMSKLKKKSGTFMKTEEIELSGWSRSSEDSKKVLQAIGDLKLKRFGVSYMDTSVLGKSDYFSIPSNKVDWMKLLENTEKVSFKQQKMDVTSLGGLLDAVKAMKKKGHKVAEIDLPNQRSGTYEEQLTQDIIKEISKAP